MRLLLWPFRMIWMLLNLVFQLTGRLICAAIGLVLLIIGIVLTVTIVGGIIGIPLLIFGFLLLVRSIF